MQQEIIFRKFIAIGQKTKGNSNPYGRGFNYTVEASFALKPGIDRNRCLKSLEDALAAVDHKALGIDVELGIEPTSAKLCVYLESEIRKTYPNGLLALKLIRGDALAVATGPLGGI